MAMSVMVRTSYVLHPYHSPIVFIGNLHLNVVAAEYTKEIEDALEPFVYELVGESV